MPEFAEASSPDSGESTRLGGLRCGHHVAVSSMWQLSQRFPKCQGNAENMARKYAIIWDLMENTCTK